MTVRQLELEMGIREYRHWMVLARVEADELIEAKTGRPTRPPPPPKGP